MFDAGFLTSFQIPRRREDHVPRPNLVAELESRSATRLQVIVAPAAYGKTTLLSEFAQQSRRHICWFTMDDADADVGTFLGRVHSSVRAQFPQLEPLASYPPGSQDTTSVRPLVVSLVNAVQALGNKAITLIWDDFHRVTEEEQIQDAVELIVEHLPANCTLVIGSRTMPQFDGLDRLVAYRDASILTAQDLAFTADEIREFLELVRSGDVSLEQAQEIRDKTEGWVGGVLSLESGGLANGELLKESRQSLQTFAITATARESDEGRWFLESTSVLPYLDPKVCDEALGIDRSAKLLARAYEKIGFLSQVDEDSGAYKWHDLIREGLESHFRVQRPGEYTEISKRAAKVFDTRGEVEHALALLFKAEEHAEVGRLLVHDGERFLREGRWVFLNRCLEQLPAELVEQDAKLLELRGRMAVRFRDGESAVGYFNKALLRVDRENAQDRILVAQILINRSFAFQLLGLYTDAVDDAQRALDLLERWEGPPLAVSRAQRQLGENHAYQGQFHLAEQWLLKALPALRTHGDTYETANVHGLLGWACVELGKTSEGHLYLEEAVRGWRKLGNLGELSIRLNNLAQLWYRQGQLDTARDLLEEALQFARDSAYTRFEAVILVGIGDIERDGGDLDKALKYYDCGLKLARQASEANLVSYTICVTGETYRLKGEYEKAEIMLMQAEALAESQGQRYERSLALLYLALLRARGGDYSGARKQIEEAAGLLRQSGSAHGKALLDLYSAECSFLERDLSACELSLVSLADRCQALGYSGFLVPEARRAPMMFQWAASKSICDGFYVGIWEEARAREPSRGSVASRGPGRLSLKLQAYGFGRPRVLIGDDLVTQEEWQSPKARELFYYLLTQSSPRRKESICADLWPEASPVTADNNFHSSLRRLRQAIHPAAIALQDGAYEINPHMDIWFDEAVFLDTIERAEALPVGSPDRASLLEDAVKCYGGPFLEDFYSEWVETVRRETEALFLRALSSLAGFHAGRKDFARALGLLQRAKEVDQLEEEVRLQMMRCYVDLGDAPSAVRTYEDYRNVLHSELGAPPSRAMHRMYGEAVSAL